MNSIRAQLITFIETGSIAQDKVYAALIASKVIPEAGDWKAFIDRLLLWLGGMALAFAVMFFIAYNWTAFGDLAKFAMVEVLIALCVAAYCLLNAERTASKLLLLMASLLLGVLLALFGQTYQTGADPWQLFFYWGLMIMPWAAIARFAAIWIVWLALINLSIVLYFETFLGSVWFMRSDLNILWVEFGFNTLVLLVWELASSRFSWLRERWATRLIAVCSGSAITWLVLQAIFDSDYFLLPLGVWLVWLLAMYMTYRRFRLDLFMLAGLCASVISVLIPFFASIVLDDFNMGGLLLLALMVIALGAGAAFWLKQLHREVQS